MINLSSQYLINQKKVFSFCKPADVVQTCGQKVTMRSLIQYCSTEHELHKFFRHRKNYISDLETKLFHFKQSV